MSKKPNTTSHTEEISGSDAQQEDSAGNEDIEDIGGAEEPRTLMRAGTAGAEEPRTLMRAGTAGAEEPQDSAKHRTLYDNIYKYIFSNKIVFYYFIKYFVRPDLVDYISLDDIHEAKNTFINNNLDKREVDVAYRVRARGKKRDLYVMIELQSTVKKRVPVRMHTYIMTFYDTILRSSQAGDLPSVFPIILYTGKKEWPLSRHTRDFIAPDIPKRYMPSLEYFLVEGNTYSQEDLLKLKGTVAAVLYADRQDEETFHANCVTLVETLIGMIEETDDDEPKNMFARWFTYMFEGQVSDEEFETIKATYKSKEVQVMLADTVERLKKKVRHEGWQEGIAEGVNKGRQEGIAEGRQETAKAMVEQGAEVDFIHKVTGLSVEEIQDLART